MKVTGNANQQEKKFRARENVLIELGLATGKSGRSRVAVFHQGDLEMPSDLCGLIYISLEDKVQAKNLLKDHLTNANIPMLSQDGS